MVQPMNYQIDVQQPFQAALQGYQMGAAIRDDQAAQQQRLLAQQAQQSMQADVGALIRNPNASPADFAAMTLKYPALKDHFKQANEMLSADQKQNFMSHGTQVYSALSNNRPDIAKSLITDRAAAMRNSGNEKGAADTEMIGKMIDINPALARNMISLKLTGMDEKFAQNVASLGQEGRAAELAPGALRKVNADADAAEADAVTKGVTAKYAPQRVPLEIEKLGQEIGLTSAQIGQAKASAAASYASANNANASAAKTRKEMEEGASGLLKPEQRVEVEGKLRKEYSDQTKGFQDVREAYRRIKASENNAVGDLSLIFGYMKMLDPGSVVREGEFATAQNAAGVPDRVWNLYNRIKSGERLSEGQRKAFTAQGQKLFESAQKQEQTVRTGLERIATGYGLKKDNIFYDPANAPETSAQPGAPVAIKSDADYNALPAGATFIAPDGSTRRKP